jgi:RNA polymerase sigma-70 factor (ECF subfamily)
MSSLIEDRDLVRRAVRGDRRAFETIIMRYQQPLFNYLGRLLGERELALDFTQEVFLKAYASLPTYRPEYKFSTWLFTIASNHLIDHWRKKKIPVTSLDHSRDDGDGDCLPQVADGRTSVARNYELREIRGRIEKALGRLPAALRELFVLRHVNDFSYEEIAALKKLPVGTVKNRVFQAKEMLRGLLEEAS